MLPVVEGLPSQTFCWLCKFDSDNMMQKLYQDWEIILRNKGLYSQHFNSFVTHEREEWISSGKEPTSCLGRIFQL